MNCVFYLEIVSPRSYTAFILILLAILRLHDLYSSVIGLVDELNLKDFQSFILIPER